MKFRTGRVAVWHTTKQCGQHYGPTVRYYVRNISRVLVSIESTWGQINARRYYGTRGIERVTSRLVVRDLRVRHMFSEGLAVTLQRRQRTKKRRHGVTVNSNHEDNDPLMSGN